MPTIDRLPRLSTTTNLDNVLIPVQETVNGVSITKSAVASTLVSGSSGGPTGNGYTGSRGPAGPVGPIGIQGPTGFIGSMGFVGSTGAQGPGGGAQGPMGLTGSIGLQGPIGPSGGGGGSQGPIGPIGPIGLQGPLGSTGFTGSIGAQGPGGGAQGPIGFTGSRGFTGSSGAGGPSGAAGPAGAALAEIIFSIPTDLTTGTGINRWYIDQASSVTNVLASVSVPSGGSSIIFDVNKNGTTIFTTQANRPTIPAGGYYTFTNIANVTNLALGDYLSVDVDQIGSTASGSSAVIRIKVI